MKGLKHYRLMKGITQSQLSDELGIPISNIAMYEVGDRTPGLERAISIAKYFGVSVEDIFFAKESHE